MVSHVFILGLDGDKGYRLQTLNKRSAAGFIFFFFMIDYSQQTADS